jgi:hypothetical protein
VEGFTEIIPLPALQAVARLLLSPFFALYLRYGSAQKHAEELREFLLSSPVLSSLALNFSLFLTLT